MKKAGVLVALLVAACCGAWAQSKTGAFDRDGCKIFSSEIMKSFYEVSEASVRDAARAAWGEGVLVRAQKDGFVILQGEQEVATIAIKNGSVDYWSCE